MWDAITIHGKYYDLTKDTLNFKNVVLSDFETDALSKVLLDNRFIRSISFDGCTISPLHSNKLFKAIGTTTIECIDLDNARINNSVLYDLANLLKNANIKSLHLNNCGITDMDALWFSRTILLNSNLVHFSILKNDLSKFGLSHLDKAVINNSSIISAVYTAPFKVRDVLHSRQYKVAALHELFQTLPSISAIADSMSPKDIHNFENYLDLINDQNADIRNKLEKVKVNKQSRSSPSL